MISGRAPPYGLISFHVQRSGEIHIRYGAGYDSLDPDHVDNAWVLSVKRYIEKRSKKFISQHQEKGK